jgi:hypothetical protein
MRRSRSSIAAVLFALALALLPALAAAQAAPTAPSLTGTWTFTVTTDAGAGTPTVTLTQKADSLTGHYSSTTFGEQDLKGSVTSRDFTFQFNADVGGQSLSVVYKGTIESADALKGTVTFAGVGAGTFTAAKKPPPALALEGRPGARRTRE